MGRENFGWGYKELNPETIKKQAVEKKENRPIIRETPAVKIIRQNEMSPLEPKENLSRRDFLRKGLVGGAALALGGSALWKMAEKLADSTSQPKSERKDWAFRASEEEIVATPEQQAIAEEDIKSISEVLNFRQPGRIEFNRQTVEAIKNHWKKRYQRDPKLKESFHRAYHEMGYWQPHLEAIFEVRGLPKEYIFLAIPESHWQPQAVSRAGATGPYQFMKETGRSYALRIEPAIDERKDPLKSARACANLLYDLYQPTRDWDLALSGYNGGFIWQYLRQVRQKEQKPSYNEFLKYQEGKLNKIKQEVEKIQFSFYQIKKSENFLKLARRFGAEWEGIKRLNYIMSESQIKAGRKIKIPVSVKQKEEIYQRKIGGLSENLNYPAKFYAVLELIKEGFVKEQAAPLDFKIKTIKQDRPRYNFYEVKAGDNLKKISRRFKVDLAMLKKENAKALKKGMRPGQEIKIPSGRRQWVTLADVAKEINQPVKRLSFLNPALKIKAPIPDNYPLRV